MICTVCNIEAVESEQHFLLVCTAYKFPLEDFLLNLEELPFVYFLCLKIENICEVYLNERIMILIVQRSSIWPNAALRGSEIDSTPASQTNTL